MSLNMEKNNDNPTKKGISLLSFYLIMLNIN